MKKKYLGLAVVSSLALSLLASTSFAKAKIIDADTLQGHPASDFAETVHAHSTADVTGLQEAIDAIPAGPEGPMGPTGPQGVQGVAGADGAVGQQGPAGADGLDGAIGATGSQGMQGPAGVDGINGTNGLDGTNGLACWDINGDDIADPVEDVNDDGYWDALDCQGTSNGVLFLSPYSTEPFACNLTNEGAVALTSLYTLCVCDSTDWVLTVDGATSCDWGIPTVISAGQVWMDRNLGASQVATSYIDSAAYGDFYQWGRGADGHQLRTSLTTTNQSSTDEPGHGDFITTLKDWRVTPNDNLWQGVSGTNNPCPAGFRLPTATEWGIEQNSWINIPPEGAYESPLKLPQAGNRNYFGIITGDEPDINAGGYYWSSTSGPHADEATLMHFMYNGTHAYSGDWARANGLSVRCIQD